MLILMIVSGIPELNMKSISTVRKALFLDVSDEEASINFKHKIQQARTKVGYRKLDNIMHLINKHKKTRAQEAREKKAQLKAKHTVNGRIERD